jgi:serine/threonine-protein kinase
MGEVWLAKHRRLAGKLVAVKVRRTSGQLPADALARFRHEAEIAARLEHPNIVQVLDFNALPKGEPYLVMEFLKGESLAQRLKAGPLPLEQVLEVVRQVGAALQAAHAAGVVHRDLKPENIFLVPTALGDQVKVLDFGISKLADSQTVQTTDSVLIGTPLYMSPEQALGNNRDVTAQSDVFSLASITYEALTGTPPFLADNVARVVFRIAYEKHRPLLEVRPDLPASVAHAVERGLEKDRAHRTPDMATFVAELTGRALASPRHDEGHMGGVYTPDVPVSASLAGAATISRDRPTRATAPSRAPRVAGLGVLLLVAVAALAWRATAVPDVSADAGVAVTQAEDAGSAVAVAPADAGAALADVLDAGGDAGTALAGLVGAGVDTRDVGSVHQPVRMARSDPSGKPTAAEREYLDELQKLADARRYAELLARRSTMRSTLRSPASQFEALKLLTRTACVTHDDHVLRLFIVELRSLASSATFAKLKRECLETWPDAALMWED